MGGRAEDTMQQNVMLSTYYRGGERSRVRLGECAAFGRRRSRAKQTKACCRRCLANSQSGTLVRKGMVGAYTVPASQPRPAHLLLLITSPPPALPHHVHAGYAGPDSCALAPACASSSVCRRHLRPARPRFRSTRPVECWLHPVLCSLIAPSAFNSVNLGPAWQRICSVSESSRIIPTDLARGCTCDHRRCVPPTSYLEVHASCRLLAERSPPVGAANAGMHAAAQYRGENSSGLASRLGPPGWNSVERTRLGGAAVGLAARSGSRPVPSTLAACMHLLRFRKGHK